MSDDFLSRWSRRKIADRKGEALGEPLPAQPTHEARRDAPAAADVPEPPATLPPVESLTSESDFAPFMQPQVDSGVKREALKVLMRDPRFNVMDGLDVYIDDYSKPDPLPEGWLEQLNQMKWLTKGAEEPKAGDEAENGGEIAPSEVPAALQKGMPEQPVEVRPPDTAKGANGGTEVGESRTPGT